MRALSLITLLGAGLGWAVPAHAESPRDYRVLVRAGLVLPDGTSARYPSVESIDRNGDAIAKIETTFNGVASMIWAEIDGVPTRLARTGDVVGGVTVSTFVFYRDPPILRGGRALFTDDNGTLWMWDLALSVVVRPGDVVDGVAIGSVASQRLNARGDVLFRNGADVWFRPHGGALTRVAVGASNQGCAIALDDLGNLLVPTGPGSSALRAGPPGALVTIMEQGQPAPGGIPGETYNAYLDCDLADDTGVVTFATNNTSPGFSQAIFQGTPGAITRLLQLPVGATVNVSARRMVSAGAGLVAIGLPYAARLDASGTHTTVASVGDPAPGLAGETIATLLVQDINAAGQILMSGTTSASRSAIWQATPGKPIELVAAGGQMFDLGAPTGVVTATDVSQYGGETGGGYRMLSDDGDVVFQISYAGGSATLVAVSALVVNAHGDAAQAGALASCDTGQLATNGDPECTLRAAIQVANARDRAARIRFDLPTTSPIVLTSPLPSIAVSIDITGPDGQLVEIRPAVTTGSGDGLTLAGSTSRLRNLALRGFAGDGIAASAAQLTVSGCELTDSGGWGVHGTAGTIDVEAAGAHRSDVARNGAGGVLGAATEQIRIASTDVHDNAGGGVVSDGAVELVASTVTDNEGPGVAVLLGPGSAPVTGVTIAVGGDGSVTQIDGNQGEGILTLRGGVRVSAPVTINGNGAWGVSAAGQLAFGAVPVLSDLRMSVSDNGAGAACFDLGIEVASLEHAAIACRGGGLFSVYSASTSEHVVASTDIVDNAGPGVLVGETVTLAAVTIARNAGPGVKRALIENGDSNGDPGVIVSLGSTIRDNAGYGIASMLGFVTIDVASVIEGNHGAGIRTEASGVFLDTASGGANGRTSIAGNGLGACTDWDISPGDEGVPGSVPCELGGIVAPEGRVYAVAIDVVDNQGAGITAEEVDLHDVTICGNSGEPLVVSGTRTLDMVDTCGGGGGGGGGDDEGGGGGCLQVGGDAPAPPVVLALLTLLGVRARRPRTRVRRG